MVDSAASLVDEVLPKVPLRQRVLSVPFQLRFLFCRPPPSDGKGLGGCLLLYRDTLDPPVRFAHDTAHQCSAAVAGHGAGTDKPTDMIQ